MLTLYLPSWLLSSSTTTVDVFRRFPIGRLFHLESQRSRYITGKQEDFLDPLEKRGVKMQRREEDETIGTFPGVDKST